jgi:hypothetical protein
MLPRFKRHLTRFSVPRNLKPGWKASLGSQERPRRGRPNKVIFAQPLEVVQLALRGLGRSKKVLLHARSVGSDGQMEHLNAMQEPLLGQVLSEIALDFCELLFR